MTLIYKCLDSWPWRPMTNGERRAVWSARYHPKNHDDERPVVRLIENTLAPDTLPAIVNAFPWKFRAPGGKSHA